MISQTQHIALSILIISLSAINNNDSLFYTSATSDITSNTLNNRLRISTNLRPYSNSAAAKSDEEGTKIISDIVARKSRRELQEEDVVDQREDSIEGQEEELFISQNCLNLLAGKLFLFLSMCVLCLESGDMANKDGFLEIVYAVCVEVYDGGVWLLMYINFSICALLTHTQSHVPYPNNTHLNTHNTQNK